MQVPPFLERERIASILRRDVEAITDHMWCYHRLSCGEAVDCMDGRVWNRFRNDHAGLMDAADAVMGRSRGVPLHLRRQYAARSV